MGDSVGETYIIVSAKCNAVGWGVGWVGGWVGGGEAGV